jgi:hypothetical protein
MNFNVYNTDNPDIEGMRSRAGELFGNPDFANRRFSTLQTAQVAEATYIVEAETPVRYDPDTEVKEGGIVGAAALLPSGEILVCVNDESLRNGVGTRLLEEVERGSTTVEPFLDMGVHNVEGQHFALTAGYRPSGINVEGRVIYTRPSAIRRNA